MLPFFFAIFTALFTGQLTLDQVLTCLALSRPYASCDVQAYTRPGFTGASELRCDGKRAIWLVYQDGSYQRR